ncbi:MAG: 50S ribosomal protein L24 [Kiritimatiellae bacterium]|nr:50S ribosomal protein L24 [Kiritimatiellia bacterium]
MSKAHIKKGDIVVAITGDDAAIKKTGKVLQIIPRLKVAVVEGLNYVKKHMKPTQDNPQGGIIEKEAPIALSNLKQYDQTQNAVANPDKVRIKNDLYP